MCVCVFVCVYVCVFMYVCTYVIEGYNSSQFSAFRRYARKKIALHAIKIQHQNARYVRHFSCAASEFDFEIITSSLGGFNHGLRMTYARTRDTPTYLKDNVHRRVGNYYILIYIYICIFGYCSERNTSSSW